MQRTRIEKQIARLSSSVVLLLVTAAKRLPLELQQISGAREARAIAALRY
jgi:hypothetical protein